MFKRLDSVLLTAALFDSARLIIALLVIVSGGSGCSKSPANQPITQAPTAQLPANVTVETRNPLPNLGAAADAGKPLYQANCALCHGDFGASDGPASSSYDPRPTDLTKGKVITDPDGAMFLAIKNGKGKMPGMKRMTDEQIWQVVAYMRTLAKQ